MIHAYLTRASTERAARGLFSLDLYLLRFSFVAHDDLHICVSPELICFDDELHANISEAFIYSNSCVVKFVD
jgi:hypothetical protein